ncbi:LytR/AlgR family response regulator transcription factor [Thiothrix eikelboomii]|uniref:Two component transcriptional regulator, LytTR family n=1 Tax=Thiothrix eikelboomii TaxID=92487 RepID=A0A1T4XZR9_9GAMM|nr:LytTR family DNA-binding domain-containing protein [Thiothrix eikelboomii]SKA94551.1 two component transcriptional regulator, LytTR family [Thiothrix eikelboomii]
MSIKILVVDDEEYARERIKGLIARYADYDVCAEAENGAEAVVMVERFQPDIVLMDITMPGMDGLEAARHIATMEMPPAVIFTTAYGEYALEAFSTKATGYLMKPIRQEQLLQSLEQARSLNRAQRLEMLEQRTGGQRSSRKHICARMRGNLELIPIEDVVYFQADQKYVTVRHNGGEVIIEESLKSLETDLADRFIRIHRNALVAKSRITGLTKSDVGRTQITLDKVRDQLEVSRRHLAEVRRFVRGR